MGYRDRKKSLIKFSRNMLSGFKNALELLRPSVPNDSFEYSMSNIWTWAVSKNREMNALIEGIIFSDQERLRKSEIEKSTMLRNFFLFRLKINQYISRYASIAFYCVFLLGCWLKKQIYFIFPATKSFFVKNNKKISHPELTLVKKIELWIQSIPECCKQDQAMLMVKMADLTALSSSCLWNTRQETWVKNAITQETDKKIIYYLLHLYLNIQPKTPMPTSTAKKIIRSLACHPMDSLAYESIIYMGVKEDYLNIDLFPKKIQEKILIGRHYKEFLSELTPIQDKEDHSRSFLRLLKNDASLKDIKPNNQNLLLHVLERIFVAQSQKNATSTVIPSLISLARLICEQSVIPQDYMEEKICINEFSYISNRLGWNKFREGTQADETSPFLTLCQLRLTPGLSELMTALLSKISKEHWDTHGECYMYVFKNNHKADLSSKKELPAIMLEQMESKKLRLIN